MAVLTKGDFHNGFIVKNAGAVDLANHTAVASVNTDIAVTSLDGADAAPLRSTDVVLQVILPTTFPAGIVVQTAVVKDENEITLRTTNPSAGAIDPSSIAAGDILFVIGRP